MVADHLSRHFPHLTPGAVTAVAGHLAYATAGQVLDIAAAGTDMRDPAAWCSAALKQLWTTGDAEAITKEPCVICGEAEGYANMLICDICKRPTHLQCLGST